ncbi:N-acetylneuraminate synthase family protein [Rhizobacter sp. J219]|uniref:N-acetylneuraminate synthase family protein n=1 Tax=Rhizobacter sp. J219 TaxID=2898430 RepID=UPI0021513173|nr:N-acetylneuraminate synthase family protein [Rhizobacter sp. J219]MCR5885720.1 N-acetylneuraminate synthase family protein [Rhizobacter sp. J219]
MQIANRSIGPEHKPFIVAEVAQSHDGSLGTAFAFIDAARECGADAIKFQTHIASEESTAAEPWRVRFSRQDATRYDYWRRMEFTQAQWGELKAHADARGIIFLSPPFSIKACEWLAGFGMAAWKLASGEVHNEQLVEWIAARGEPMIVSSGLSRQAETAALVQRLRARSLDLAVLHCTTRYPTPPEEVGMNIFESFVRDYDGLPVGLSDHSGTTHPGIVASYLGASVIEVHLTLHSKMFGPDVSSSLTPDQLSDLVKGSEFAWRMRMHQVDKDNQLGVLVKERSIFGRSLVAARDIAEGEVLDEAMVAFKKPGGGLVYQDLHKLIGRKARRALPRDHRFGEEDVR